MREKVDLLEHVIGHSVRIVDSRNFPLSTHIAAALVIVKPGGLQDSDNVASMRDPKWQ